MISLKAIFQGVGFVLVLIAIVLALITTVQGRLPGVTEMAVLAIACLLAAREAT